MTSETQIKANRENAQKSSGPRTKAGKARSSQNARKHGLYAEQVVMPGEDPELFEAFRSDLHAYLEPVGPLEEQLAERIIAGLWRLRRVPEIEAALFDYWRYSLARNHARQRVATLRNEQFSSESNLLFASNEVYTAAKKQEENAEALLTHSRPFFGATFVAAEPMLSRLTQIAAAMEASVYRALKELKRLQDDRKRQNANDPVIEVHDVKLLPRRSREVS